MTDLVCNIAKGRIGQWMQNVEDNVPAAAVLRIFVFTAGADEDYRDADTITALEATSAAEVTNSNYTNKVQDETDIVLTVDDTANTLDIDISDVTWTAIGSGDSWARFITSYDDDGSDTDTNTIPQTSHDFAITPDGSDITAQIDAAGFFRAS